MFSESDRTGVILNISKTGLQIAATVPHKPRIRCIISVLHPVIFTSLHQTTNPPIRQHFERASPSTLFSSAILWVELYPSIQYF